MVIAIILWYLSLYILQYLLLSQDYSLLDPILIIIILKYTLDGLYAFEAAYDKNYSKEGAALMSGSFSPDRVTPWTILV